MSPEQTPDRLQGKLTQQRERAKESMSTTLSNRLDLLLHTYEKSRAVKQGVQELFNKKAKQVTQKVEELQAKHRAENREQRAEYYEQTHQAMLKSLGARFEMALSMAGDDTESISDFGELSRFLETEFQLLKQVDVDGLMAEAGVDMKDIEDAIQPSYLDIAIKLDSKKALSKKDEAILQKEFTKLLSIADQETVNVYQNIKDYVGYALLSKLSPKQRMELLSKQLNQPNMDKLICTLTATNYITVAQGLKLAAKGNFKKATDFLNSPKLRKDQTQILKIQQEGTRRLQRAYHQNTAGKLLSAEGIFAYEIGGRAGLLMALGSILSEPKGFYKSPLFWMGIGITGATADSFTGGLGQGVATRAIAKMTKSSKVQAEEAKKPQEKLHHDFIRELMNKPKLTKFYYRNADKIVQKVSQNHRDGKKLSEFSWSDLGQTEKQIQRLFPDQKPAELLTELRKFATVLYRNKQGIALKSAETQRQFINSARTDSGLSPYSA